MAKQINDGKIEDVISLALEPKILEQAQLVAELIESGEMGQQLEGKQSGIKRNLIETKSDPQQEESGKDGSQSTSKKLKLGMFELSINCN